MSVPQDQARQIEALLYQAAESMRTKIMERCRGMPFPEAEHPIDRVLIEMGEQTRIRLLRIIEATDIQFRIDPGT